MKTLYATGVVSIGGRSSAIRSDDRRSEMSFAAGRNMPHEVAMADPDD
jgi:hypothetical protein